MPPAAPRREDLVQRARRPSRRRRGRRAPARRAARAPAAAPPAARRPAARPPRRRPRRAPPPRRAAARASAARSPRPPGAARAAPAAARGGRGCARTPARRSSGPRATAARARVQYAAVSSRVLVEQRPHEPAVALAASRAARAGPARRRAGRARSRPGRSPCGRRRRARRGEREPLRLGVAHRRAPTPAGCPRAAPAARTSNAGAEPLAQRRAQNASSSSAESRSP